MILRHRDKLNFYLTISEIWLFSISSTNAMMFDYFFMTVSGVLFIIWDTVSTHALKLYFTPSTTHNKILFTSNPWLLFFIFCMYCLYIIIQPNKYSCDYFKHYYKVFCYRGTFFGCFICSTVFYIEFRNYWQPFAFILSTSSFTTICSQFRSYFYDTLCMMRSFSRRIDDMFEVDEF